MELAKKALRKRSLRRIGSCRALEPVNRHDGVETSDAGWTESHSTVYRLLALMILFDRDG